jgi:hypothetical protein
VNALQHAVSPFVGRLLDYDVVEAFFTEIMVMADQRGLLHVKESQAHLIYR